MGASAVCGAPRGARPWLAALALWAASPRRVAAWDYGQAGRDWRGGFCEGGSGASAQSPIDLPTAAPVTAERKLFLKYPVLERSLSLYNDGRSLAITMPEEYRAGFGLAAAPEALTHSASTEAAFRLWQVNLHAPAEHTIGGRRAPLEVQLVHQQVTGNRTGQLAVVSVLFHEEPGASSPFLERLMASGLPQEPWAEVQIDLGIGAAAPTSANNSFSTTQEATSEKSALQRLLIGSAYYAYEGSLTVPPCEPGVRYFVRRDTTPASEAQLQSLSDVLRATCPPRGNYRDIPMRTTAASMVGLGLAVDWFDRSSEDSAVPSELPSWESGQRLPESKIDYLRRTVIEATDSSFDELLAGDSLEVREAKTAYSMATLDYRVAMQEETEARQNLINAKEGLANAHGPVDALHFKWQVADCEDELTQATRRKDVKQKAVIEASSQALAIVAALGHHASGQHPLERGLDWTTPLPFRSAAEELTTTVAADADGFLWRKTTSPEQVAQRGGLVFPVGLAASPFTEQAAHTAARIGAGSSSSTAGLAGVKLGPGLQPDLPQGQVPGRRLAAPRRRCC